MVLEMEIAQLRPGMKRVNLEFKVLKKIGEREVTGRYGKRHRVAEFEIEDKSGKAVMTLWDNRIDGIKRGARYEIKNGYTTLFRGELRVSVGKYGEIEEK